MKLKRISDYLVLERAAANNSEWRKVKRICETALKHLADIPHSHEDEFELYMNLGTVRSRLAEYSSSLEALYKAKMIGYKCNIDPAGIAFVSFMMGADFVLLKNIDQALSETLKVEEYYGKYGFNSPPMEEYTYVGMLMQLAYCYLYKNQLDKAGEIIEKKIMEYTTVMSDKLIQLDYYHLKGEYYMEIKEFTGARKAFQECISISSHADFPISALEARIHIAVMDLIDSDMDSAVKMLKANMKNARRYKFTQVFCESALLLSKCYALQNLPQKAAMIESRIKPVLYKLDIVWLYEKNREFDVLCRQLKDAAEKGKTVDGSTPKVLIDSINNHHKNSQYKDMLIGDSPAMHEVCKIIEKIAPTGLPVLIQGETGTGKELIAHAVHNNSARAKNVWLAFNCAALPQALLESELFGYAKGAFTGAVGEKKGYLEIASEGTLFIDEIADMPAAMQQKLLRALEEKQVRRIGSEKPVPVNPRFVFACNRNLEELVKKKLFREDLFYRMNAIVINLPALRERKEDIPALVRHFLRKYSMTGKPMEITDEALNVLCGYNWPGNIRELENEIKKICVLNKDSKTVDARMISESVLSRSNPKGLCSGGGRTLKELREEFERNTILETLKKNDGNVTRTARELGYARPSFYDKIKQLGIDFNLLSKTDKSRGER